MKETVSLTVEYGPMHLTIQALVPEGRLRLVANAGQYARRLLTETAREKGIAKMTQRELLLKDVRPSSAVVAKMIEAVRASGDESLTPMAAVAGAIADLTADYLEERGASKVVVNNGGDIAVRLQPGELLRIGVAADGAGAFLPMTIITYDSGIRGIATSGLGGRSLTKGIATAAVVAADSAALADACATSIGNAVFVHHPLVKMVLAEELDPATDIRGQYVVKEVGALPLEAVQYAVYEGQNRALELLRRQVILRAAVYIDDWGVSLPESWLQAGAS